MSIVHLLSNSAAGSGRQARARRAAENSVRSGIRAAGHRVVDLRPASPAAVVPALIAATEAGMSRLVIAGGDGLIHRTLPALAHSGVTVGIVGIGTGNDFARALGLPTDTNRALAAALDDHVVEIDLVKGDTDDAWAATVVTGGFSGEVNERANGMRLPIGSLRYTAATLLELARLEPVHVRLAVDDEVHALPASLFAVGNTRFFGGGMAICPTARPDDGRLDITVIGPVGRTTLARVLPTVFSGRHVEHPEVTVLSGRRVEIETSVDLWADGETFTASTLMAEPGALRVAGSLVAT